ncbi:MAG TPA: tetratricopeptide repeat protein, partial [Pyrinomonadaceae bacterium]
MSKWNRIGAAVLAAALILSPLAGAPTSAAALRAPRQDDAPSQAEQETFNRGRALFAKGQYEQAATIFRDFLKGHPDSFIADLMLLWLGRSYIELGRFPEAEQVAQRLRTMKDTPFTDIFETELQTARTEAASRPAAPAATPTPRATATPATAVARATPTPVPPRPRATPRPTPVEVANANTAPRLPEMAVRGSGDAERPRTLNNRRGGRRGAPDNAAARNTAQPA